MKVPAVYLTLQQALRSTVLTFFPATFFALIIWATSGSINGNTAEPLRAGTWIWLISHQIGFKLVLANQSNAAFTYLPMLLIIFPYLAMRSSIFRLKAFGCGKPKDLLLYLFWYLIIALFFALVSMNKTVKPIWWQIPVSVIGIFVMALIFGKYDSSIRKNKDSKFHQSISPYLGVIYILMGLGCVFISFLIIANLGTVENLQTVIQPGIIGSITLVLIQIAYLPNILWALVNYLVGFGFNVGSGTLVSPFAIHLKSLPSIPILGIIPNKTHSFWILGGIFIALVFWKLQIYLVFAGKNQKQVYRRILISVFYFTAIFCLLGYLGSGELITTSFAHFGVDWWKTPSAFIIVNILLLPLSYGIYWSWNKLRSPRKLELVE